MINETIEDVVIVGSGPAGLTAGIYAARGNLNPLILEGLSPGGQIIVSHDVENYPGVKGPVSGYDLIQNFREQAESFGVRFQKTTLESVKKEGNYFIIQVNSETIKTQTLIIATGAEARRLPIPTEPKFYGRGVSGCATCDGAFFRNKEILVVGGGDTAMEDALYLTRYASKVTIVHRRMGLRASSTEIEKVKKNPKIEWLLPYIITEILGDNMLTGVMLENQENGEIKELSCNGVFVAIGHNPQTAPFITLVDTDENGFIITESGSTHTRTSGLFACGDVSDPDYKQVIVAAGQGCMAAIDAGLFLT